MTAGKRPLLALRFLSHARVYIFKTATGQDVFARTQVDKMRPKKCELDTTRNNKKI